MKKKILEKDGFYLSLFVFVFLVAIVGVWFTNKNVDELASSNELLNNANKNGEDEIHLIEKNNNEAVPTATDSDQNLSKAKQKEENNTNKSSKLSFVGNEIIKEYSETEPSYSKTLDVWEIHKGLDVSVNKGQEIKSLLNGTVVDVFKDDEYGVSIKVKSDDETLVIYSNLDENTKVKKGEVVKEGQLLGIIGNTTIVESEDGAHIHLEAYKGDKSINPMDLIK